MDLRWINLIQISSGLPNNDLHIVCVRFCTHYYSQFFRLTKGGSWGILHSQNHSTFCREKTMTHTLKNFASHRPHSLLSAKFDSAAGDAFSQGLDDSVLCCRRGLSLYQSLSTASPFKYGSATVERSEGKLHPGAVCILLKSQPKHLQDSHAMTVGEAETVVPNVPATLKPAGSGRFSLSVDQGISALASNNSNTVLIQEPSICANRHVWGRNSGDLD
jgi:hypothetical protein